MMKIIYCLQIENWSNNPDAFVEDEDEDSFAYSVRISAQDLLLVSIVVIPCLIRK